LNHRIQFWVYIFISAAFTGVTLGDETKGDETKLLESETERPVELQLIKNRKTENLPPKATESSDSTKTSVLPQEFYIPEEDHVAQDPIDDHPWFNFDLFNSLERHNTPPLFHLKKA
jgi:hypothetical protein